MERHAPGPWVSRNPLSPKTDDRIHQSIKSKDGQYLAHIPISKNFYEAEANARLIATAPELLASLESMVCHFDSQPDTRKDVYDNTMLAAAKQVIAKTKGISHA